MRTTESQRINAIILRRTVQSYGQIAERLEISKATAYLINRRYQENGEITLKKPRGRRFKINARDERKILQIIQAHPMITRKDVITKLTQKIHVDTLSRFLKRKGFGNFKMRKRPFLNSSTIEKRKIFASKYLKFDFNK